MLKATIIGKEETFRSLGIRGSYEIELESLIITLRKQFEQEYRRASENAAQEIPKASEKGISEALSHADNHPVFPLNWSENRLTREEMNER